MSIVDRMNWRPLPSIEVRVAADPRLVREVLGAVVHVPRGELAGHAFEQVAAISDDEADVQFRLRLAGVKMETLERVRADETGVHFTLLRGYLPAVEEHMLVDHDGANSVVRYSGRYKTRPGFLAGCWVHCWCR